MSRHYYLRSGRQTLGPFTRGQIKSFRSSGRLKPQHQISSDRVSWIPAEEFFIREEKAANNSASVANEEWYYCEGQTQIGPVTRAQILTLIDRGTLKSEDLVWKDGLDDWTPVSQVHELAFRQAPRTVQKHSPLPPSTIQRICLNCGTQDPVGGMFCPSCGKRYGHSQQNQGLSLGNGDRKDRIIAALFAILLGSIGVHHFYLGNPVMGVIYILFCWTFIPAIVSLIEGITGSFKTTS